MVGWVVTPRREHPRDGQGGYGGQFPGIPEARAPGRRHGVRQVLRRVGAARGRRAQRAGGGGDGRGAVLRAHRQGQGARQAGGQVSPRRQTNIDISPTIHSVLRVFAESTSPAELSF